MWQDTLVILGMFALRLGVPVVLTIAVCHVLDRLSVKRAEQIGAQRRANLRATAHEGKVVRQLQCWEIKRCDEATRAACPAYQRPNLPCWLALQLAGCQLSEQCLTCSLYDLRKAA
jgi:hypothetical protein